MPQPLYTIAVSDRGRVVALNLKQTLDVMEFDRLNEALLAAIDAHPADAWVVDLTQTTYIGSAVLGLLVNIRQRIRHAHGQLTLSGLSPELLKIFRACCMERLFTIVENYDDRGA